MDVRSAVVADVPAIQRLINGYAETGVMLPRSLHSIYGQIRDHLVALEDGNVVGCVALSVVWQDLAEVRSLAVAQSHAGHSIGTTLVSRALAEARTLGVNRVFVLTYIEQFFHRLGFRGVEKSELPHKIWRECVHCVHFPDCDETALVIDLADVTPD